MWLFFNQIAYRHYHLLDNGMVIEHAHPYKNNMQKNTPYQSHKHSDAEYLILAQVSNVSFLLVFFMALLGLLGFDHQTLLSFFRQNNQKRLTLSAHRLRGPPHFSW